MEPIPITSQKHDPAWKHCQMFKNGDRVQLKCLYCGKLFKGGGIHRIKEHLAGHKGNASTCLRVPPDVRGLMQQSLDGVVVKKRNRQKLDDEITNIDPRPRSEEDGMIVAHECSRAEPDSSLVVGMGEAAVRGRITGKRRRGKGRSGTSAIEAVGVSNSVENSVIQMAIGRFLYDIGAPLDAVNSPYFKPMIEAVASGGSGVVFPSYHDLRGWVLKNSVEEVRNDITKNQGSWERNGCSILVDEWTTEVGRHFLSFSVNSSEGTVFLKTMEAADSFDAIYDSIKSIVEEVGPSNVVQVITSSNNEKFTKAGKSLIQTFPNVYWAPCAIHLIDAILEDFGSIDWIHEIIEQARSITRFVYNHSEVLNIVRRYTFCNDIVDPGIARFSANFTTLKRLIDLKYNLHSMVTSQEWADCLYSKKPGGLSMSDFVSNESFWSSCILIANLTSSLLRVLRIVSNEKRASMGYIYAAMYRAKETIKKELVKKEDYMSYWDIIDQRWKHLRNFPLHAAGFYLNPKFFYGIEGDMHNDIFSGMLDCIERLIPDTKTQFKTIKEINLYKSAAGDFGRKMATRTRESLLPAEWWSTYGGGCPNLARLATRILSQTCSMSGCLKQNRDFVRKVHDTGNSLEQQRLVDLVFVQQNLGLGKKFGKSNVGNFKDPIAFDSACVVQEWVRRLDDDGDSDWMAANPPTNTLLLGPANDDAEDLGTGFEDYEILNRGKDGEDENVDDNVVIQ